MVPSSAPAEPAALPNQTNPLQEHGSATDLQSNADAAASNKDSKREEGDKEDEHDLTANESLDLTTKRSKMSRQ